MKLPVTMKELQIRGTDGVMVCDLRNNANGEAHGKIIVELLNGNVVNEEALPLAEENDEVEIKEQEEGEKEEKMKKPKPKNKPKY